MEEYIKCELIGIGSPFAFPTSYHCCSPCTYEFMQHIFSIVNSTHVHNVAHF